MCSCPLLDWTREEHWDSDDGGDGANGGTSFNRLDLPEYKDFAELQQKLSMAIDYTEGFGQE